MTNDEESGTVKMPWEVSGSESFIVQDEAGGYGREYDLEERTAKFGEAAIEFLRLVPSGPRTNRLIDQLTGAGTSVGGNYCEADDAISKKEFIKIIGTCRKEARESKFFLRMIAKACAELKPATRKLWLEPNELHLIFSSIRRTAQENFKAAEK